MMFQHQTPRARPGTTAAGSQRPQLTPCQPSWPPTCCSCSVKVHSHRANYPVSSLLTESPPCSAPFLFHEMPFPSRWEVILPQQMANISQVGHVKKTTGTKRREAQANSKLHTQKRSHGSLSCASQCLSRLPFCLRQKPQVLITNFLFDQEHQVTVQPSVQRCSIVVFISICQKPAHDENKAFWQHWSDPHDSSPLSISHPSSSNTQTWIHRTKQKSTWKCSQLLWKPMQDSTGNHCFISRRNL